MIAYPVSEQITSWAVTLPELEGAEADWGLISTTEMDTRKSKLANLLGTWKDKMPEELVRSATRMIKFGLFDRDELNPRDWFSARTALVGDAAHPTSPHLGQGANQALEDCWHLSAALPDLTQSIPEGLNGRLSQIFKSFAEKRQPRTSAMVRTARTRGEMRVVTTGPDACRRRNEQVKADWKDADVVAAKYDALCREPFP
jgi:salicylate hydroxylase